ncbi:MAG: hypothetical protein M9944_03375 [Rhizobiaceae bacterium]|nr:hypothetical protein [Rhizobiaceae bacterium]
MHALQGSDGQHSRSSFGVNEQIREHWSRCSVTFEQPSANGIHLARELSIQTRRICDSSIGGGRFLRLASGTDKRPCVHGAPGCDVDRLYLSQTFIDRARIKGGSSVRFHLGAAPMMRDAACCGRPAIPSS